MCPWCYIGHRRFQRALSDFGDREEVDVVFRSFQLDPSASRTSEPVLARLERKYGADAPRMLEHASRAAEEEGLNMRWDAARSVNTLDAHRLLRWARADRGPRAQHDLAEALFEAHFTRGEDIAVPETLAALAGAVGLDPAGVEAYLRSGTGLEETRGEIEDALRMGIRSVPTFVFEERWAVEGAQPIEVFGSVLERVRRELEGEGLAQQGDAGVEDSGDA